MTPHIEAKKEEIAKIVIMPGDPLRAKMIAETYLENPKLINQVRGILGYTGTYKGKEITVMASGMGIASMGIYSYELFDMYDVDYIIRVGSCGSYVRELNIHDMLLVESSFAKTDYDQMVAGISSEVLYASEKLNSKIFAAAAFMNKKLQVGRVHCTDAFYSTYSSIDKYHYEHECVAVEMETFSLFQNANVLNKQAACVLTVTDSFITNEKMSSEDRQNSLTQMIELVLEAIKEL